ncbi:MAG: hypothetical protein HC896_07980 [Bacteroidales bacterium]|nr:hypothetical protein [Bacteroidales bacterium]
MFVSTWDAGIQTVCLADSLSLELLPVGNSAMSTRIHFYQKAGPGMLIGAENGLFMKSDGVKAYL